LIRVLDVLHEYVCALKPARALSSRPLRPLASRPVEKSGLRQYQRLSRVFIDVESIEKTPAHSLGDL